MIEMIEMIEMRQVIEAAIPVIFLLLYIRFWEGKSIFKSDIFFRGWFIFSTYFIVDYFSKI